MLDCFPYYKICDIFKIWIFTETYSGSSYQINDRSAYKRYVSFTEQKVHYWQNIFLFHMPGKGDSSSIWNASLAPVFLLASNQVYKKTKSPYIVRKWRKRIAMSRTARSIAHHTESVLLLILIHWVHRRVFITEKSTGIWLKERKIRSIFTFFSFPNCILNMNCCYEQITTINVAILWLSIYLFFNPNL